jgi:hypothetical protein
VAGFENTETNLQIQVIALMMEAVRTSETPVYSNETINFS